MRHTQRRRIFILLFLIYMAAVVWFTLLKRTTSYYAARPELFWSYKIWLTGSGRMGLQIFANIAMFVPFGFFLAGLLPRRRRALLVPVFAALFSLSIETLQLSLLRGVFEWDDMISNTTGALLGLGLMAAVEKIRPERRASDARMLIGVLFAAASVGVFLFGQRVYSIQEGNLPRVFCCQVDAAAVEDGELTLRGFAFYYERPKAAISLLLRNPESGETIRLAAVRTASEAVDRYFACAHDYAETGFTARGKADPGTEYELFIKLPLAAAQPTGIWIEGEEIRYAPKEGFAAPALAAPFVTDGTLRAYHPEAHCWVYQYEGALYWIADQDYAFEEDGSTYIQYQLWTTQVEKLPEKRLKKNHRWDNIGSYFERYELDGDFGPYRVMRRELPTAYAVTSVATGMTKDGAWIWKSYFRPIYRLAPG